MLSSPLGIISGTGFYAIDAIDEPRIDAIDTPYGRARLTLGSWQGLPVAFLTRHGAEHSVPPHLVNYRANIRALAQAGCRDVIAMNVTGGIDETLRPGDLVCLDDFLDFTKGREQTFHDGTGPEGVVHVDLSQAYHPTIRREILEAAADLGVPVRDGGVYACFEGPRFETPAEIRMARLLGAHVAGMTGVPEVNLAAEAGLRYAAISLVVNPAAGVGADQITMHEIRAALAEHTGVVLELLEHIIRRRVAASVLAEPLLDKPTDLDFPTDEE